MVSVIKNTALLSLHSNPLRHPIKTAAGTHCHLLKSGTGASKDASGWNKVIISYARSGDIGDAQKVFDEMPQQDTVSWNSLIAGYVGNGGYGSAWGVLKNVLRRGLAFDQYTIGSLLKSAASVGRLDVGCQLHCLAMKSGLSGNVFSGSALVDMYAKCSRIGDAYLVFVHMPERNIVSWNAVIGGFCQVGDREMAFLLFGQMEREGMKPDEATFASILTLVNESSCFKLMTQMHGKIVKYGRVMDTVVYNAAITAYSQCRSVDDSRKVFEDMDGIRDLVTWNSLLAAYAFHGLTQNTVELFVRMQELRTDQDMYTFTSVISACCEHGQDVQGKVLHGLVVKKGLDCAIHVSNALIAMYLRCSENCSMEDAMKCFASMKFRDSVSWNSIMTGLSQNWYSEDALKFFNHMRSVCPMVDQYAFSATLRACSDLAVLQIGRGVHGLTFKSGFVSNDFVSSSLIFMYSKCGVIDDARRSFDETYKDSSVIWNSLIFGYATHGQGQIAVDVFNKMLELRVEPDHITFVGLLSACSHIGLVEEGSVILKEMEPIYGIHLRMEHYACGVDLFGRAGHLDKAITLINSMPFEPDGMVWATLLGACKIHGNIELASHVSRHLLESDPTKHCTYVLLSHMYSGFGMWENRAMIQRVMRNRGVVKVPGWSWIEVNNRVHSFNAEDRSHSQVEEIYEILGELMEVIEMIGHEHPLHPEMHIIRVS